MQNLIDQITDLSLRDKKTLSQKALKLAEEAGELAKVVLPYEGAAGTNHRVPDINRIGEECADSMLVAFSIMKSIGMTEEQIFQTIQRKTDYWQFLADNEDKADIENLIFEIHITVKEAPSFEIFRSHCETLNVKPIVLDLYAGDDTIMDVMTSSVFRGTTRDAVTHTKWLADQLREAGYDVVREKIETVPWHPTAQIKPKRASAYFEAHFAFTSLDRDMLTDFAKANNIHLSRNMMKKGDERVMMGTYRLDASKTNPVAFKSHVDFICKLAKDLHIEVTKTPVVEYSLFDTNEQHDGEWLNGISARS